MKWSLFADTSNLSMKYFFRKTAKKPQRGILSLDAQVKAWRKANRKMDWDIGQAEFESIGPEPEISQADRRDGFSGVILSYGFGDDGHGHSDVALSGRCAWDFAAKRRKPKIWQCEYIDFEHSEHLHLRPAAPLRPKGFYFSKFRHGDRFQHVTVAEFRKRIGPQDAGCGPEGFQLLTITHPHFASMMNSRQMMFMTIADFDVAPYGYGDFFDAPQIFCSNDTLGLGIGHVDRVYPLFGIPTLRF